MDLLERMLKHDRWATATFLDMCRDLPDPQLDQDFDVGHRTLRATLDHMTYVVGFWCRLMDGEPHAAPRDDLSIDALAERHQRNYDRFEALAHRLVEEQRLDETFVDHYDYRQSKGATILQVCYHNVQHRSDIRHMLVRLGLDIRGDYDPQEWEHYTHII
jgi:uncharacterized damage-inducible protein DinB